MNTVICGATGGIGRAIAYKFAKESSDLILLGTSEKKLKQLSDNIRKLHNVEIRYFICDIDKIDTIQNTISQICNIYKSIDILINASGIFTIGEINRSTEKDFYECLNVNLILPYFLSKGLFKPLSSNSGGTIVNIGSSSSMNGFKNTAIYCASKHAILGFSRALNDEWKENGIVVQCICPGTVDTVMAEVLDQDKNTFIQPDDLANLIFNNSQLNKTMMVPEISVSRKIIR
jgi:3-oxoacyl-[acyl-carrier protein] reductase